MNKMLSKVYKIQEESLFLKEEVLAEYDDLRILLYKNTESNYYTIKLSKNEVLIRKSATLQEANSVVENIKYRLKMNIS